MLMLAYGGGNKGTWLVKSSQKSTYVIYERPLIAVAKVVIFFKCKAATKREGPKSYLEKSLIHLEISKEVPFLSAFLIMF